MVLNDAIKIIISNSTTTTTITRGVSYHGLAIYIKKYFRAKEGLWKLKYFTIAKI